MRGRLTLMLESCDAYFLNMQKAGVEDTLKGLHQTQKFRCCQRRRETPGRISEWRHCPTFHNAPYPKLTALDTIAIFDDAGFRQPGALAGGKAT